MEGEDPSLFGEDETMEDENDVAGKTNDDGASMSILAALREDPPPESLTLGWVVRHSHSQPGCIYYYHQDTGDCRWEPPYVPQSIDAAPTQGVLKKSVAATAEAAAQAVRALGSNIAALDNLVAQHDSDDDPSSSTTVRSILKNDETEANDNKRALADQEDAAAAEPVEKKAKTVEPREVRVLHLLKKHRGSRRPASWRNPKITDTREEALVALQELMEILREVQADPKELRATFEELARTESDCSSFKRGGDLGFFGRRKMQPAFEHASFALKIGELSDVVETSSGVHAILRIG
jgi:NIMA-interacting peptidyl-prolyl cis-trans isomerase 1|uniref:peptidylprolyl isomerase n=1 Tax=Attheya septentrionalis TaxID=420275 RepID=A0A7S2XJ20_9STRA|mmetsp:Transcript_12324/g.22366  ORF Transcript_12324/g.22366 Transcript_12324/m.22366 type:complete len:295 (+) Transcript_12324:63-947(+)